MYERSSDWGRRGRDVRRIGQGVKVETELFTMKNGIRPHFPCIPLPEQPENACFHFRHSHFIASGKMLAPCLLLCAPSPKVKV